MQDSAMTPLPAWRATDQANNPEQEKAKWGSDISKPNEGWHGSRLSGYKDLLDDNGASGQPYLGPGFARAGEGVDSWRPKAPSFSPSLPSSEQGVKGFATPEAFPPPPPSTPNTYPDMGSGPQPPDRGGAPYTAGGNFKYTRDQLFATAEQLRTHLGSDCLPGPKFGADFPYPELIKGPEPPFEKQPQTEDRHSTPSHVRWGGWGDERPSSLGPTPQSSSRHPWTPMGRTPNTDPHPPPRGFFPSGPRPYPSGRQPLAPPGFIPNATHTPTPVIAPHAFATNQWEYKDPEGNIQGPFTREEIEEWNEAGFFPLDLPVRAANESPDSPFIPLSTIMKMWTVVVKGKAPPGFVAKAAAVENAAAQNTVAPAMAGTAHAQPAALLVTAAAPSAGLAAAQNQAAPAVASLAYTQPAAMPLSAAITPIAPVLPASVTSIPTPMQTSAVPRTVSATTVVPPRHSYSEPSFKIPDPPSSVFFPLDPVSTADSAQSWLAPAPPAPSPQVPASISHLPTFPDPSSLTSLPSSEAQVIEKTPGGKPWFSVPSSNTSSSRSSLAGIAAPEQDAPAPYIAKAALYTPPHRSSLGMPVPRGVDNSDWRHSGQSANTYGQGQSASDFEQLRSLLISPPEPSPVEPAGALANWAAPGAKTSSDSWWSHETQSIQPAAPSSPPTFQVSDPLPLSPVVPLGPSLLPSSVSEGFTRIDSPVIPSTTAQPPETQPATAVAAAAPSEPPGVPAPASKKSGKKPKKTTMPLAAFTAGVVEVGSSAADSGSEQTIEAEGWVPISAAKARKATAPAVPVPVSVPQPSSAVPAVTMPPSAQEQEQVVGTGPGPRSATLGDVFAKLGVKGANVQVAAAANKGSWGVAAPAGSGSRSLREVMQEELAAAANARAFIQTDPEVSMASDSPPIKSTSSWGQRSSITAPSFRDIQQQEERSKPATKNKNAATTVASKPTAQHYPDPEDEVDEDDEDDLIWDYALHMKSTGAQARSTSTKSEKASTASTPAPQQQDLSALIANSKAKQDAAAAAGKNSKADKKADATPVPSTTGNGTAKSTPLEHGSKPAASGKAAAQSQLPSVSTSVPLELGSKQVATGKSAAQSQAVAASSSTPLVAAVLGNGAGKAAAAEQGKKAGKAGKSAAQAPAAAVSTSTSKTESSGESKGVEVWAAAVPEPQVPRPQPEPAKTVIKTDMEMTPEFRKWCIEQVRFYFGVEDLSFIQYLCSLCSRSEVAEHCQLYLAGKPGVSTFIAEFLKRRDLDAAALAKLKAETSGKKKKKAGQTSSGNGSAVPSSSAPVTSAAASKSTASGSDGWNTISVAGKQAAAATATGSGSGKNKGVSGTAAMSKVIAKNKVDLKAIGNRSLYSVLHSTSS